MNNQQKSFHNNPVKYTKLMTIYYATQKPLSSGIDDKNTAETYSAYTESVRLMTNAAGESIPGTSINYHAFNIPGQHKGAKHLLHKNLVNEHARIVLPGGFLNIWGQYADSLSDGITNIPTTVFFGSGTGVYKDVGCVRIFYDNDTGLRRMVCYKME